MFDAVFDLPLVVVGTAILILLCVFALSGLAIFSRHILPRLKLGPEESVFTSAMMQAVMVFYGLAVALIAVAFGRLTPTRRKPFPGKRPRLVSCIGR
jgi:hypothetical protein